MEHGKQLDVAYVQIANWARFSDGYQNQLYRQVKNLARCYLLA